MDNRKYCFQKLWKFYCCFQFLCIFAAINLLLQLQYPKHKRRFKGRWILTNNFIKNLKSYYYEEEF